MMVSMGIIAGNVVSFKRIRLMFPITSLNSVVGSHAHSCLGDQQHDLARPALRFVVLRM